MSITTPDLRISEYNPVVATTDFPATFPVFDNDDIKVFVDGLERDDFAVTATYVEGIATNAKAVFAVGIVGLVQVVGARDPHRTNRFGSGGPLPPRDLNLALDTLEAEAQEARRDVDRALKVPLGSSPLGIPEPEDNTVLGWDGENLVNKDPAQFIEDAGFATAAQGANADTAVNFVQAGTGSVPRTTRNKNRDVINVLDFGAVGNGTTDDSAAIQKAVDLLRSLGSNNRPGLVFGHEGGAKHNFCISNPVNLTGFNDAVGMTVDLNGSVIIAKTNGKPVFDMLDSQRIEICNGGIYGDPSAPPSYGVQMGRALGTVPAPLLNGRVENIMRKVRFTGAYSGACMINSASEICLYDKCGFWNSSQAAGSACVILDSRRAVNLLSDFFTVTQPNNVASSFNDTLFLNCTFEKIGGENPALGNAIKIYGGAFRAMKMISCYAQNEYGAAVYVSGDITACEFDLHCEATNLANNFLIDTSLGNTLWRECKIMEYGMFCTDALIKGSGGSGNVFWSSGEISVPVAYTNKKLFNKNGATFRFHGEINIGDAVSAGTYDLSVLNAFNGEVKCSLAASNVVVPGVGAFKITDFNSIEQRHIGLQHFMGSLALEPSGTNLVVSAGPTPPAGTLTIPRNQGTSFYIASGGNITSIAIDPVNDKGRIVCLVFGYTGTITNSLANKIFLAGNYSFVANNTLWLISDGSKWAEICRCANVVA